MRSPVDAEALVEVVESIDMQWFWILEPRQIHDPPGMKRMRFDHPNYAREIARRYNKRAEEPAR